jgi:hypothetical protein
MHDLFLRLGISTDASADDIAAAIESKPHLATASEILLNPQRRAAYQRTVFTLRSIGELRHRLGLDNDTSWFQETCGDFSTHAQARKFTAKAEIVAVEPVAATPAHAVHDAATRPPKRWMKPLLAMLAIAALLLMLLTLL